MNPAPSLHLNVFKMYRIQSINKNSLNELKGLNKGEGAG